MKEVGTNQRVRQWMQANRFAGKELAMWAGISKSAVSQVLNGRTGISLKSIQNILEVHKELNARWLLTGEGEMYYSQTGSNSKYETKDKIISEMERIIEAKDEIIKLMKQN
ncbi:MAG: helix-turn-helix domain-containing protein [Bacteroidetes bacterium]|jgi:transcriptional regulator with XRE-family HTH domain|nr:helix-turn-helix domain-containing protein [Bacteroidota bacterium]MBT3749846.1 helix-turn-helix domain-containing protein [Bacteroidota bacterium]MBT4401120.1 helix-turn-helix domain-containing protein [Bacteroidota bacterium]MBT4410106.1 helix-turn-helix domain-containing protein [Bacteroidota bacterium]MBT7466438.1 helix-turn-helix domain-containing protein [Bacteroidota bacterium]